MSIPGLPDPAKLVVSVFLKDTDLLDVVADALTQEFGAVDLVSNWLNFDYTNYYKSEFGAPLFRRVFSFRKLIDQEALPKIKRTTNEIEQRLIENGGRQVNIDPGYMLRERFVLATGKNFAHRIYIGQGIYADLTLTYQKKKGFCSHPWTYPDYAAPEMLAFLEQIRDRYVIDLGGLKEVDAPQTTNGDK